MSSGRDVKIKQPNFPKSCQRVVYNKRVIFLKIAQVSPYIWATFEGKLVTKNFKNRPVWSHWLPLTSISEPSPHYSKSIQQHDSGRLAKGSFRRDKNAGVQKIEKVLIVLSAPVPLPKPHEDFQQIQQPSECTLRWTTEKHLIFPSAMPRLKISFSKLLKTYFVAAFDSHLMSQQHV